MLVSDPFSAQYVGEEWRTQSWLTELVYAWLDGLVGNLSWVNVFVFVVGSAMAGLVGLSIYRNSRSPVSLAVLLVALVWLAIPFLHPRPVIVSYLLLALLVVVLQNKGTLLWLVVPIMWIWVGVHGSWMVGGALLVLEWLRTMDRSLLRVGLISLAATILTAHGLGVYEVIGDFIASQGALDLIQEWKPPDFGELLQLPYLVLIAAIVVAATQGKVSTRDLIVILPFMFLGMTSRRALFPAAIVLVSWAALAMPPLKTPRSSISPKVVGALMAITVVGSIAPLGLARLGVLDAEKFPTESFLEEMAGKSVFHDDVVGGFLIYSQWPETLVYIDDRAELYGEEYFQEFVRARQGQYEELFEELRVTVALTREDWGLTDRLDRAGWVRVVEENSMVLFERP